MFPDVHPIETIEAEAWNGKLEIFKMPWEQSGDETQISSHVIKPKTAVEQALVLEYNGANYTIDSNNTGCVVGRGRRASLQVDGKLTSRQHAELSFRQGRFNIRDESTNGTYVVEEDGTRRHLRREEGVLVGNGTLGFGSWPEDDPGGSVRYMTKG